MKAILSGIFVILFIHSISAQTHIFELKKGELDHAGKGIPILEGWVTFQDSSQEKLFNIPRNLKDLKYTSIQISQAEDSILTGLCGLIQSGSTLYWVDRNNDEDFSNDEPIVFKKESDIRVARIPIAYDDKVGEKTVSKQTVLSLYERKPGKLEYHLNELWETVLSVGGESINVGIQRFPPSHALIFIDINYSGKYEKPFFLDREVLALGGKFLKVKVDFANEIVILKETDQKPADEGYPAPEFETTIWPTKEKFELSKQKKRITVITFWSPLCSGSKAEAPYYDALRNQFQRNSFTDFIAVTNDSSALSEYLLSHQHSFIHVVDEKLWALYGVTAPFVTFIVDQNGQIVKRYFRFNSEIATVLTTLLKN